MTNSVFRYLYRDGSNYKSWGEVVFRGEPSETLTKRIVATLSDSDFFIAEQVRVPECFFDTWPCDADDHCWHEFHSLEATELEATDKHRRTVEQLVCEFEHASARGWNVFDPQERAIPRASVRRATVELESLLMERAPGTVVHRDPGIMGGELVFLGTRVPVRNLFDYLGAGDSLEEFLDQFPTVTRELAIAALEIASEIVEAVANSDR